jgi:hypothetical protein
MGSWKGWLPRWSMVLKTDEKRTVFYNRNTDPDQLQKMIVFYQTKPSLL